MVNPQPWPKKGRKAFISARDQPCFWLQRYDTGFPQKPDAFKVAAELIIDACQQGEVNGDRDTLFFPVAFLYRHGLELLLKDILVTGVHMHFFTFAGISEALASHSLANLWHHAQKLLKERWPACDPAPLKATEAVINELHQADPNGQAFRYDEDRSGHRHSHKTLPDHIEITNLRGTMEGVFAFLDITASCLRDDLNEMVSAERNCY